MDATSESLCVSNFFSEALQELKYKNRFCNKKLDTLAYALSSETHNIENYPKISLYRARKYTEPDAVTRFRNPPDGLFQGYDASKSHVNPSGNEGRCNPQFIRYLYTANTIECCIAEIRPGIDDVVSVATIESNQPLKILNLAKHDSISSRSSLIPGISDCMIMLHLQQLFSQPFHTDGDYLLSQYLSGKIQNLGFDGISFYSSVYLDANVKNKNINFTIFNHEKCEVISSKLYRVHSVSYSLSTTDQ